MQFKSLTILATIGSALAMQPRTQSICDKYTVALLKEDTPANQYLLLTLLVNTVVIGNYTQPNVGIAVPGILAPAMFGGESVNLLPYFNGCLLSTNVNDMPSSVNFLDGGGAAPLMMNMPADNPNSNQFGLLTHLYQFFGVLLGCSGYGEMGFPSYMGDPSMGRVHKYMSLDQNEFGYFVSQVGAAAASFGVSSADVSAVASALMEYFGYKCLPKETIVDGPQYDSICEYETCPLAPNPDCQGYSNEPKPMLAPQCMTSAAPMTTAYTSYSKTKSWEAKSTHY